MNFDNKSIKTAARVSEFMLELQVKYMARWLAVKPHILPFGDIAYGAALMKWHQDGCPKIAWFSYAPGQTECPYLIAFRKEISAKFKLRILTIAEGEEERKKHSNLITRNTHDWGLN